ncbi:MAG: hypothetical protein C0171_03820 [Caldisphaera sp.]|nr:MAG: hypothetical protein C0171_03820 [Caldisphaera sp.]
MVIEETINHYIGKYLDAFGKDIELKCKSERTEFVNGYAKRPDIKCFYQGLRIGIESSYQKSDAEKDAENRLNQGLVDISIALHIKESIGDINESEVEDKIKGLKFDCKIFIPLSSRKALYNYIKDFKLPIASNEWIQDLDILKLKEIIKYLPHKLISEEQTKEYIDKVSQALQDFSQNVDEELSNKLYESIWRLYGLKIENDKELISYQAGLLILLSSAFYEHIRNYRPGLKSLRSLIKEKNSSVIALQKAMEKIEEIDYQLITKNVNEILDLLPPKFDKPVENLTKVGEEIAQNKILLSKDIAGRIYHKVSGDISQRKGFATYYTQIPAATLLAELSVNTLYDGVEDIELIKETKVADFACGSGTLLTYAYQSLNRLASKIIYDKDLNDDIKEISKRILENIYGIDALKYAAQITAINLALLAPEVKKQNIRADYFGIKEDKTPWLGSLELIRNKKEFKNMLDWLDLPKEERIKKEGNISLTISGEEEGFKLPDKIDLILMNPPFTRATGRKGKEFKEKEKGLFGFVVEDRERLIEKFNKIRDDVKNDLIKIAKESNILKDIDDDLKNVYYGISRAGEGLLFLYLAYLYVKENGVIGFVLPKNLLMGPSWFLARSLLFSKFHLKYVITSFDSQGYNFSESTNLSEVLIIAKRKDHHDDNEETIFVNLLKKPKTTIDALEISYKLLNRDIISNDYIAIKVNRKSLLSDSWSYFVSFPSRHLTEKAIELQSLNNMIELGKIAKIGIDRHQFHDCFTIVNLESSEGYPVLFGGEEENRSSLIIKPNKKGIPKNKNCIKLFEDYSSRLLVPDRISLKTVHLVSIYSERPILSNMFYSVRVDDKIQKALILWLNSIFGLISILSKREETGGSWISLKISQWKTLKVPDFRKFEKERLNEIDLLFEEMKNYEISRLPDQFDRNRKFFDLSIRDILRLEISDNEIDKIYEEFKNWLKNIK